MSRFAKLLYLCTWKCENGLRLGKDQASMALCSTGTIVATSNNDLVNLSRMKRTILAIIMVLSVFTMMAQDETIRVKYQGSNPKIGDFAQAYLSSIPSANEVDECDQEALYMYNAIKRAMARQSTGLPLQEKETLTIDSKNGYILYEFRHDDEDVTRIEMCFWNESDGKHRLFACVRQSFHNGWYIAGQYDDREFFRYNNATKTMKRISNEEIGVNAVDEESSDMGVLSSISLPRMGKDIEVTWWDKNGECGASPLKWNGHGFNF